MLTPGQAHDLAGAGSLLDDVEPQALIGDKAYDADVLIETLVKRQITSVIPSKANRKIPRPCDFALYCERNLVERFFAQLTTRMLRRGVHRSVDELETDIRAWIAGCNDNPRPYTWTKTAEQILDSIGAYCQRIISTTNNSGH